MIEIFSNKELVVKLILFVSSIGILISGLEWISLWQFSKDDDIFSWRVRKVRVKSFIKNRYPYEFVYSYPYNNYIIALQVLSAFILLFNINNWTIVTFCSIIIAITSILFSLRSYIGCTGADQMMKLTFSSIGLCLIHRTDFTLTLCICFIAAQLTIAYATPGIQRAVQKNWKNGNHLLLITRQHTYGNRIVYSFLKQFKVIRVISSWGILFFECGILIAFLLPTEFLLIYLFFGFLFHLLNSYVMGLNTFLWAFIGTYPAYICISIWLKDLLNIAL